MQDIVDKDKVIPIKMFLKFMFLFNYRRRGKYTTKKVGWKLIPFNFYTVFMKNRLKQYW